MRGRVCRLKWPRCSGRGLGRSGVSIECRAVSEQKERKRDGQKQRAGGHSRPRRRLHHGDYHYAITIITTTAYQYHSTTTATTATTLPGVACSLPLPLSLSLPASALPGLAWPCALLAPHSLAPTTQAASAAPAAHWPTAAPPGPRTRQCSAPIARIAHCPLPVSRRRRCRPPSPAQACSSRPDSHLSHLVQKAPLCRPPLLFSTPLCCLSRRPVLPTPSPLAAHPVASVLFRRACPLTRPLRMPTRSVAFGACPRPSLSAHTQALPAAPHRTAPGDSTAPRRGCLRRGLCLCDGCPRTLTNKGRHGLQA